MIVLDRPRDTLEILFFETLFSQTSLIFQIQDPDKLLHSN